MMADTRDRITPILHETYGKGGMVDALADHLGAKIDSGDFDSRGREYAVMVMVWDWFSGGGTAASVARKIETVLG